MMISIVDYGVGNLKSLQNALKFLGIESELVQSADAIAAAGHLILPGVGAFAYAMQNLRRQGLVQPIIDQAQQGTPILGICLGMQLLLTESDEGRRTPGFDLIPGAVRQLSGPVKVPHIGWNDIELTRPSPLFKALPASRYAYFVHSYFCDTTDSAAVATTEYGGTFPSAIERENVFGVQFHPEKSQEFGLQILKNFVEL